MRSTSSSSVRPWSTRSAAASSRTPSGTADALYGIRRILQCGAEHLPDKQIARLDTKLTAGDPGHEDTLAWQRYQQLRSTYHAGPDKGRKTVTEILTAFPTCPIPEIPRLRRTLRQWKSAILAHFETNGASNGPTEAINGVIETTRRIARGFRNFTNYRLRCLLAAGGPPIPNQTHYPCLNTKGR